MRQQTLVEHGQVHVLAQDGQGLDGGLAHAPVVVAAELQEDGEEGVLFVFCFACVCRCTEKVCGRKRMARVCISFAMP